jgi:hypothetical protein
MERQVHHVLMLQDAIHHDLAQYDLLPSTHVLDRETGARRWSAYLPTGVKDVVAMMGAAFSQFCRLNRSNPY